MLRDCTDILRSFRRGHLESDEIRYSKFVGAWAGLWTNWSFQGFDYAEVKDLAEPKPPEAPALTLSGKPDLKVYDGLLIISLADWGVCG